MSALTDRVALVTGASSGIGAGLSRMLAREGARVVLAARRAQALERVANEIRQSGGIAVPGGNPANFLQVTEVVDVVRFLLSTGDNVKLGPEILVRTMRNPMQA